MSRGPTTNAKAFLTVSVWREETVFPNDAQFKMVNPTDYALTKFQHLAETDERDHVEVSPESGIIVQKISQRVSDHGGRALIIDYGHEGTKKDTFRVNLCWILSCMTKKLPGMCTKFFNYHFNDITHKLSQQVITFSTDSYG